MNFIVKPLLVKKVSLVAHKGTSHNYAHPVHQHHPKAIEIIYVDYGNISLDIEDETFTLKAGDIVFISGRHSFYGIDGAPFDFMNIMFRGELPENMLNNILPTGQDCANIMTALKEESIHGLSYGNDMIACKLTELIIILYRQLNIAIPDKPIEAAYRLNYKSEIINKAVKIIAKNYSTPLDLKQLSIAVRVSIPTLRALIKKETGESFTEILHNHRINAAKYLLRQGNMPIQEIANAVGYASTSFFFKIFKKYTGMTPREYSLSLGDPSLRV